MLLLEAADSSSPAILLCRAFLFFFFFSFLRLAFGCLLSSWYSLPGFGLVAFLLAMRSLESEEINSSRLPLLCPRCSAVVALLTVLVKLVHSPLMSDDSFNSARVWNLPPMVALFPRALFKASQYVFLQQV